MIQNDNDTLFRWLEASESQVTHKLSSSQGDLTADAPDVEALAQHVDRASCFGRIQQIEVIAQQLLKNQDFQHENCEQLLELIPKHTPSRKRPMIKPQASQYLVLGMYAYGNHYGVTNKTRQFPKLTQYLRAYMQHHHGDTLDCNALLVSCNARHPVHRDLHNDPEQPNVVIGLGNYDKGRLWVATSHPEQNHPSSRKVLPTGQPLAGQYHDIYHKAHCFSPKEWHGPETWTGTHCDFSLLQSGRGVSWV